MPQRPIYTFARSHGSFVRQSVMRYYASTMAVTAPEASGLLNAFFEADAEALADTGAVWREAREIGPVVRIGPSYLLTRYSDVHAAIRDTARFSSDAVTRGSQLEHMRQSLQGQALEAFEEMYPFQALFIADTDDPQHARLRRIVHRAFTPRRIAMLADATERYVDEIVGELAAQDVVDLTELAFRVPLLIIGDLVGMPRAEQKQVKEWSDLWQRHFQCADDRIILSWEAQKSFRTYIERMIERHRLAPDPSDLVSAMLGAEHEEVLTADEFAALFFVFIVAGHETTTNLIATGTLELLRRREEWRALCENPELIPGATDELVRLVTPSQWIRRRTTEDVVVAGHDIPAESHVLIGLASANRDPDIFPDPDEVDVRRPNAAQHVAFGHGIHFCLGSSLARLEGSIVLRTLTQRFPELELASGAVEWTGSAKFRTLKSLPVRFGREHSVS